MYESAKRPSKTISLRRELSRNKVLYIMVLLPLIVLIIFKYIPIYGLQIAFKYFRIADGITGSKWVGLQYFRKFLESYLFWPLIRNTLAITLYSLAAFPLSLVFALLINYVPSRKFVKIIQTTSYAPHFISTVVICGMITQFLNARTGMINAVLAVLGIVPQNYMAKPELFASIYVWSDVWQHLGYSSIIFIATLASVQPELHEAAIIDGASIIQRIRYVDIPGILPVFSILLILRCGTLFNIGFEKVLLLQNNLNISVSEVISTYTYNIGLVSTIPQFSYAAAIGLFTSVINMIMLIAVNQVSRSLSGSSLW